MSKEEAQRPPVPPVFSAGPSEARRGANSDRMRGRARRRSRGTIEPPPDGLSFEQEAAWRARQSKRGKRHRGPIDSATPQLLDSRGAADPPFIDQYESALAETQYWQALGFLDVSDIVRWRSSCPGLSPDDAWELQKAGVTPRIAKTRWNGTRLAPDGAYELWRSIGRTPPGTRNYFAPTFTAEDAIWLLRSGRFIA